MSFLQNHKLGPVYGTSLIALLALLATSIAKQPTMESFAISPLIVGIVLGIILGNSVGKKLPTKWHLGVIFSTKTILRAGIVFYGFRLTFQDVVIVGWGGVVFSLIIVSSTFIFGYVVGTKFLKLDRDTSILISAGSSICGAAAVLATEPVIKAEPYKTSVAVATVVVFGTIAMFLYPFLFQSDFLAIDEQEMGTYLGGTLHEVAHVVGAGYAMNMEVANTAVIVKMLRVMLLAPFLIILGVWLQSKVSSGVSTKDENKTKITIPWFAFGFIAIVAFNSLNLLSTSLVSTINSVDAFVLTMAMTALGMETRLNKFKGIGLKPIYLASILFIYLVLAGYGLTLLVL